MTNVYKKNFKCPLCEFTYVWENTNEDNKLANDHMNSHKNKSPFYSWTEVIETLPETVMISELPEINNI